MNSKLDQSPVSSPELRLMIIKAAAEVLNEITGVEILTQKEKSEPDVLPEADIYGVMEFTGQVEGTASIALNKELAAIFSSTIAFCDPSDLQDEDLCDGVGEIINQISGKIRTALWDAGFKFEISTPKIYNMPPPNKVEPGTNFLVHLITFEYKNHPFS